jgi:type IV fimbrial biogenesis protein FimT
MIAMFIWKLGVCPSKRASNRGFTMVELLVTIGLISILTTLALPSYNDMVQKRKLNNNAQQLAAFINQGQTEAARRNRPVTFSYIRDDHDTWCVGASLGEDDCVCTQTDSGEGDYCAIDGVRHVLSNDDFGNTELVHSPSGTRSFSFDPIRGILLESDDAMFFELHTDSRDYKINLEVNESGNVKLCSKDDAHRLPGYGTC